MVMITVGLGSTSVLTRVCTLTVVEVLFAARTTDAGGVRMSALVAVPPEVRFTVMALAEATDALITKVAGAPWDTTSLADWMVRVGVVGAFWRSEAARTVGTALLERAATVCAVGGPMMRPADTSLPSV